jgi:hypothetical protein
MTIIPVARILVWAIVGFIGLLELPGMTWHRWELPLPASIVAVNHIHQLCNIGRYLTRQLLYHGYTYYVRVHLRSLEPLGSAL